MPPGTQVHVQRKGTKDTVIRKVGRIVGTDARGGVVYTTIVGTSDHLPGVAAAAARCAARAADKSAAEERWEAEELCRQQGATDEQFRHDMGYLAGKAGV